MKNLSIIAAFVLLLTACTKPDLNKAKETAEACMKAIDKGDYAKVRSEYYTEEFVIAESEEKLKEKCDKLKEITGPIESYELREGAVQTETGEEGVVLVYFVKHSKLTTREEFFVIIEGGKHKIASHIVTNE